MVLNMPEEDIETDKQDDSFEASKRDAPAEVGKEEEPSTKPKSHDPGDKSYKYEILFIMNHQFVDGISGHDLIYKQFLPILNKIINKLPVDDIFLTPHDVTPSYEEDILGQASTADKKPAWYVKAVFSLRKAMYRAFGGHDGRIKVTAEGSPFLDEKGMGIFKFCLQQELVARILHERKNNDVSVHSILVTGLSFAVIKLLQYSGQPLPKKIESSWPIDSRKKLAKFKSPQPLGMFISSMGMTSMKVPRPYEFNREVFWHAAAKIGQQVRKGVQNQQEGLFLDVMSYLYDKSNVADFGTIAHDAGLLSHFDISNLGKCSPGQELDATLPKLIDADEIYFGELGQGSPNNPAPFFNTVVTHKEKMFIVSCYNKRWVTRELAGKLMRYLEEVLDEVCESPKKD